MADESVTTNFLEWEAEFKDLIDGFSFVLPGKDQSLGRDLASTAALGIADRSISEQADAQGSPWKPNEPKYAARKAKEHGVYNVGILTGQMLSLESLKGETEVEPNEVVLRYGTNTPPVRFATYGTPKDDEPSDRQKATWFTDSGREFYELSEQDAVNIYAECAEALADYLEGA